MQDAQYEGLLGTFDEESAVDCLGCIFSITLVYNTCDSDLRGCDNVYVNAGVSKGTKHSGGVTRRVLHPRPYYAYFG